MSYRPATPFTVPAKLLIPAYTVVKGVRKKVYQEQENGELFFCSFKTYGGTEKDINGVCGIEDTANVETWYRPDITSSCRIYLPSNNAVYDIINEPENIEMRNQFCKFKVRRVKGGA